MPRKLLIFLVVAVLVVPPPNGIDAAQSRPNEVEGSPEVDLFSPPPGHRIIETTEYEDAIKAFERRCEYDGDEAIADLFQVMRVDFEKGETRGAMLRNARRWCRENGYADRYNRCVPPLGTLVEVTEFVPVLAAPMRQPYAEEDANQPTSDVSEAPPGLAEGQTGPDGSSLSQSQSAPPAARLKVDTVGNGEVAKRNNVESDNLFAGLFAGLGCMFLIFPALAYFIPTLIAFVRNHHNSLAILALNVLLGWTFVGWVVALVWSLTAKRTRDSDRSSFS